RRLGGGSAVWSSPTRPPGTNGAAPSSGNYPGVLVRVGARDWLATAVAVRVGGELGAAVRVAGTGVRVGPRGVSVAVAVGGDVSGRGDVGGRGGTRPPA